ncbi:uncharacterized protein [Nicotiana sylvestris]|uniref:uncharacterized protein n=1 Tax=Nicotiana sylvestris TaxID=4096 RepID=UPI00388CBF04
MALEEGKVKIEKFNGASFYSTSCKELLHNYIAGKFRKVYLADGEPLDIVGKCEVHIKISQSTLWKLKNVRHVPGLKKNLISMSQIDSKGYTATFGNGSWKITKANFVVARGFKKGTLYATAIQRDTIATVDHDEEPEAEFGSGPKSKAEIESDVEPNLESELESNSGSVTLEPTLRRSKRVTNAPDRLTISLHYLLLTDVGESEYFVEAMQVINSDKWKLAMKKEMNSLQKNKIWILTELPKGKKALQNKCVYRVKEEHDGKKRKKNY